MVKSVKPTASSPPQAAKQPSTNRSPAEVQDRRLIQWGGIAGLAGVAAFIGTVAVVVGLGLPAADDPETLTDFANIEGGRIAEHFFYLAALILFALHLLVLHRLLRPAHTAAALFGTAIAEIGLVIMAASSVLHVSTAPMADLYTASDTPPEDLAAIEYAWHGAQSIFDTMLATGVLLVPIGIILLGVAMWIAPGFGVRLGLVAMVLGVAGLIGAAWEIVDTASDVSAAAVLSIVVFHLISGWRTLKLSNETRIDLSTIERPG
ncbi:MAG: DUF4386 family protein [Acidimicrobiales bacterium]|nr:DUF4386 family protein [Acidimicrobiales bacterium]